MAKYTPGPWRVAKVVDSKFPKPHTVYVLIDDGKKRNVCAVSVYGRDESGKPTKTRRVVGELRAVPSISDDECKANARLIAAAPDLLKACRRALHLVEDEDNNKLIVEMPGSFGLLLDLQNAIEKAEGKEGNNNG